MLSSGRYGENAARPVGGLGSLARIGEGVCRREMSDRRYRLDLPTTQESIPVAFWKSKLGELLSLLLHTETYPCSVGIARGFWN